MMYLEERIKHLEEIIKELEEKLIKFEANYNDQVLTPKEFAQFAKINENTVYLWIRNKRIKVLPNLGTALRIPLSQFYEKRKPEESQLMSFKKQTRAEELREEFLSGLKCKNK